MRSGGKKRSLRKSGAVAIIQGRDEGSLGRPEEPTRRGLRPWVNSEDGSSRLVTWAVGERHDFLLPGWASVAAGCPLLGWEAVLRSCVCVGGWDEELSLGHMKMMIQLNIQQEM